MGRIKPSSTTADHCRRQLTLEHQMMNCDPPPAAQVDQTDCAHGEERRLRSMVLAQARSRAPPASACTHCSPAQTAISLAQRQDQWLRTPAYPTRSRRGRDLEQVRVTADSRWLSQSVGYPLCSRAYSRKLIEHPSTSLGTVRGKRSNSVRRHGAGRVLGWRDKYARALLMAASMAANHNLVFEWHGLPLTAELMDMNVSR